MNPQLVGLLAAIFASNARVLAMQAENQTRVANGNSPAYGEDAFLTEAHHLEQLGMEARNAQ